MLRFIKEKGGKAIEAEIREHFRIPRTSAWRQAKRLEKLGYVRINKMGSQNQVELEASESSDPEDSAGHVTLSVAVTASDVPTQTVSGAGTGAVVLQVPLVGSGVGRAYTISWSATFDNGMHACPSTVTPENTPSDPHPFVVTVQPSDG